MKNVIIFLACVCIATMTKAQDAIILQANDSVHIIQLQELTVNRIKKSNQQQLFNFFKANNAATIEDILSRLPELSLIKRGAYGMEPTIRYFSAGQINVQVDGMRIHGACTDKMDPATIYIEPINLENLQVQTAASGFMNGSSIGGTVNMKIAEPGFLNDNKITGIFNSGYQTAAKSWYQSLRLNYSSGKLAVGASGTYRNSNNYRSGGGKIIPFSQFEKVNYSLSAKYQQNKYTYFKADLLADDGWNIGYPALPMDVGYAAARIGSFSIHHEHAEKRMYKWQAKIYANSIRHFMDDTKRPDVPMHMDMPGESKTIGFYSEGELRLNKKQKLVLRADGSHTFLKASMTMYETGQPPMYMLTWPDNSKNQYGISASWLWQLDSSVQIKLSGRTDFIASRLVSEEAKNQVSIFGNATTGRNDFLKNTSAQLSKQINQQLKISTSVSYTERLPTATELFGFYLFNAGDGFDYIGKSTLLVEKSMQADLTFLYNWKHNRVQLSGYYSRVKNFITGKVAPTFSTMTIGANGVKSFTNIPYANVAGAEASGFFKPLRSIDIVSTIRYTRATTNNNIPLPNVAPLKNISSVRYQPNKYSLQLEAESAVSQRRVSRQFGEDATNGYVLLHARLGYNFLIAKTNIELQTGIENMLDKNYHEHLDWGNIPRPGRNIYILLKMLF